MMKQRGVMRRMEATHRRDEPRLFDTSAWAAWRPSSRAASAAMSSPSAAREGGARLAPEVGGLSDVGAVWHHGPGSQSDVDLAERAAQDGLVAAQDARDARESLLCAPRAIPQPALSRLVAP
jgi:hypothetical protein